MTFRHGKDTVVLFNAVDISQFCNNTEENDETENHDVTCYGAVRKAYVAGLGDGKFTISGTHNDSANNPRAVIKPIKAAGTAVTFVYRSEGTGSGLQQSSVSVLVANYVQTSPVAGTVTWKAELQMTGTLTETDQA